MTGNPYIPKLAVIKDIKDEAPNVKTFTLQIQDGGKFSFESGQFVELTVFMYGEAPFSISSSPLIEDSFQLTIRKMGNVTTALFRKKEGDVVGIRGPFGRGWPLSEATGMNILLVGGGIGLAPLRSAILYMLEERRKYGDITLLYGARTPRDLLYKDEFDEWRKGIDVHLTVDRGEPGWKGRVGVVTVLFDEVDLNPKETICLQCGPPIMMYFVTKKLLELGFPEDHIILSLERLMKCGMGFCGHCTISGRYVCMDGPVFKYSEIKGFLERAV
ncbi:MAG: FAD/NAD(P)-binding protein [Thermoproteales archaeon]|nr:FAD/NAD(P)-binding protein [Thermoproteales archaeon]RLE66744.1 MAG: oxidoreductase [Thermoprotei archaeon]